LGPLPAAPRRAFDAPQWIVGFLACCGLSLFVWLHRRRRESCRLSGGVAAATLLAHHNIDTKVYLAEGWMADCFYPKKNAIFLSVGNFDGTTVAALSVAAHEVGHVLQRRRWYVPYWLGWLIARPAEIVLAAAFWLWLIGACADDLQFVLTALGCFAFYALYLILQLICEINASRRGIVELLREGMLSESEASIARRVLRAGLGTYLASFAASMTALSFLLRPIDWHALRL